MQHKRDEIEDILQAKGIITRSELSEAHTLQDEQDISLLDALLDLGLIDDYTIADLISKQRGLEVVELGDYRIDGSALQTVSEEVARRYMVLPIDFDSDCLVVAMVDPSNVEIQDDLRIMTGHEIKPMVAARSDLEAALGRYFKLGERAESEFESEEADKSAEIEEAQLTAVSEEAPVIKLVNHIIKQAVDERASDIHIEPREQDLRVRFRVDGVLHEALCSPKRLQAPLVSRFKVMAGIDIAESRKPQDGHCSMDVSQRSLDFRVATLPTVYGERVVLRILEKESILLKLEDLGFLPENLDRFRSSYTLPHGAILVTGPTGSGKSTTLYATLNVLNTTEKHIVTIEDPVEYRLAGINQIQINQRAGLTFARGLRSILRAAPDIVMVGEIRDQETAQIAVEAALTGHLVLSTLHTNDAPSAVSRLIEMGIAPFLIASAVDCVQAQRLARRLCPHCKEGYEPSAEGLQKANFPLNGEKSLTLYRAQGCKKCGDTGYKGRVGVHEIMRISEEIERLTIAKATADQIRRVATEQGMRTLLEDGFAKVKQGLTSIEEIMRIVV